MGNRFSIPRIGATLVDSSLVEFISLRHMPFPARLISLTTAVPPFVLRQEAVRAEAQILFRERGDRIARMLPIYDNAGVETRYSCVPLEIGRASCRERV